jgi:hypothetical protein
MMDRVMLPGPSSLQTLIRSVKRSSKGKMSMDIPEANIKILKRYSLLVAMALLFGAMNLGMYDFLPQEFIGKYFKFESELSLIIMLMIIVSFGLIPAVAFSLIFHRYGKKGIDKAPRLSPFFRGSILGFIASIFLGIFCLKGFGQTSFDAGGMAIISFLILVVAPSMILGGIGRMILPVRRFLSFLIVMMVFTGGMSSYLSLKLFIRLFFRWA